jgi:6-phosphofructokinase 1
VFFQRNTLMRIGVYCSGGDAPGMNACLRAAVRYGTHKGCEMWAVERGYRGMIAGQMKRFGPRDVSNVIGRGGTVIHTARSTEFMTEAGREQAAKQLALNGIEALVCIGGDGSFRGAVEIANEHGVKIVGCPGTIDNDLSGTDETIGFDTALNTAIDAIDKIRDTADAHERVFLIEVMGRHSGFLALTVGVAGGAEGVFVPEVYGELDEIAELLVVGRQRGKSSSIVIVAEGEEEGGAVAIAAELKRRVNLDVRAVILGHVQRGGAPTVRDRVLGSVLGAAAIDCALDGEFGVMVGQVRDELVRTPFAETWEVKKPLDPFLLKLLSILAT